MSRIFIERRELGGEIALTWDIAHHLYTRFRVGVVVIISQKPFCTLAALRKQWCKIIRKLENEYSATLDSFRRKTIADTLTLMKTLPFENNYKGQAATGISGVYILEPAQHPIPNCSTIYVTCTIDPDTQEKLLQRLAYHGLLINYYRR